MLEIPTIKEITEFKIPKYDIHYLDNGIPCVLLKIDDPDIVKLELIYDAGRYYEKYPAVAKSTASLLKEGTSKMTSADIAEFIDYYGASISTGANMDTSTIQLYGLGKYFHKLVPVIYDMATEADFSTEEINKFIKRNINGLKIELSKNEVLAYRHFTEKIYGANHPYGYNTVEQNYRDITREKVVEHFKNYYHPKRMKVFLTGKITNEKLNILNEYIGSIPVENIEVEKNIRDFNDLKPGKYRFSNNRIHQTSIRIGKRLFDRRHPDYPGIYFLNTILGGYFGSRLSENIRENKGYTYGIYSTLDMYLRDGYFMISTDVGNEYLNATIEEIYKEIDILREKLVPEEEMKLVKNYIKGNFLSMINGPLHSINLIKTIRLNGLEDDYFTKFLQEIDAMDSTKVRDLAQKYLAPESLTEVLVGNNLND